MPPVGAPLPPRRKGPSPLVWIAIAAAGVLVLGGIGVAVAVAATSGPSGPVKADECVDVSFGMGDSSRIPASLRVKCDGSAAKGKVLKVTEEGRAAALRFQRQRSTPDCPDGTDGVSNVRTSTRSETVYVACVRNLKGPHPGDPGAGGAFLGAGDCVSGGGLAFGGREKPCSGDDWYGKVIARVDTEQSCPAQTLETMRLRSFGGGDVARPVLCLGPGGQVLSPNECIADPTYAVGGLRKADCATTQAVAKVTGRTRTQKECPAGTTHHMTSKGEAYLPVLCLKKMRPTLNERIRSLGS